MSQQEQKDVVNTFRAIPWQRYPYKGAFLTVAESLKRPVASVRLMARRGDMRLVALLLAEAKRRKDEAEASLRSAMDAAAGFASEPEPTAEPEPDLYASRRRPARRTP